MLKKTTFIFIAIISFSIVPNVTDAQEKQTYGLAVLDLQAIGISETEALSLSEILRSSISSVLSEKKDKIKANYKLLERTQMEKILDEFKIQSTGCTDVECAVEFGKMFAVDQIIIGSVGLVGSTYTIIARIVDVETGTIISIVNRKQRGEIDSILDLIPLIGQELLTGERLAAPVTSPATPTPQTSTPVTPAPESRVQTPAREQYLSVKGNPENAEVFLNDEKIGTSPIDFRKVNPGRYKVRIAHTDYETHEEEILVEPGKDRNLSFKLTQYASLSFSGSPEGAALYLNGTRIGTAPLHDHYVPQGTYTIKVASERYLDFEDTITLFPGQKRTVSFNLPALVSISVDGSPPGALVTINGKDIGPAPVKNHTVTEGDYKITVTMNGYERYTENVTIGAGSPAELSYTLKPIDYRKIVRKSLVFPGSGQLYAGRRTKGAFITILQVASIGGAVVTSLNASSARSDYDDAYNAYKRASTSGDISDARDEMNRKYDTVSSAKTLQLYLIGVVAAVYAYNIIDAALFEPKIEVRPPSASLRFEPYTNHGVSGISASLRF